MDIEQERNVLLYGKMGEMSESKKERDRTYAEI